MSTVKELIIQANYYLNKQNTGNLEQDNATDTKGKELLKEAVSHLENGNYEIYKLMTDDDLSVESDIKLKWGDQ